MLTNPARVVYFQGRHERHRDLEDLLRGLEGKNGLRKEIAVRSLRSRRAFES